MGWIPSASDSDTSSSSTTNQYGTHTPILSPQYQGIFNSYAQTLGFDPTQWTTNTSLIASPTLTNSSIAPLAYSSSPLTTGSPYSTGTAGLLSTPNVSAQTITGYNPSQTTAVNFMNNNLANNPVNAQLPYTDATIGQSMKDYGAINTQLLAPIATQSAPQVASAAQSAGAPTITPQQAASYMGAYMSPFTNDVVNTTLANYDQNTANQLNALNASRDAGSAFGDRANLSDGQFLNQSDLNRAQIDAQVRNLGFTNALSPAMADAGNNLSAQTSNASNALNNNQFNAAQQNQVGEFNVGAQQQNTAQQLAATTQLSQNLAAYTGLDQSILNNVVTANGVNAQAAQNLFNAGSISQAQLNALLNAAQATNGSQFTQNTDTSGNSNTLKAGFSIPL